MTPTIFDLGDGPINLATEWPIYRDAIGKQPIFAFVQNTGDGTVYVAARTTEPDVSDTGHVLGPRESFDITLPDINATGTWMWSPTGAGRVAVSAR
ncbi:MAG: hypothetical protein OXC01_21905 [Immundisolibacterales bacterium]|nr:hypothetical protein [Immundisolibacterales bacterium]